MLGGWRSCEYNGWLRDFRLRAKLIHVAILEVSRQVYDKCCKH